MNNIVTNAGDRLDFQVKCGKNLGVIADISSKKLPNSNSVTLRFYPTNNPSDLSFVLKQIEEVTKLTTNRIKNIQIINLGLEERKTEKNTFYFDINFIK